MIGRIKEYALIALAGLVGVLVLLLKIFGLRNKQLKTQKERFEKQAKKTAEVINADLQADEQADKRAAEIARDLESGVDEYDPNELWNDPKR